MPDSIVFGAPQWIWWSVGAFLALLALVAISYRVARNPSPSVFIAAALKLIGIAALLLCLLDPLGSSQRPRPQANIFGLLVDNSQSMLVDPEGATARRVEEWRGRLSADKNWHRRLAQDFHLRQYVFDSQMTAVDDYQQQKFDGTSSALSESLKTIGDRFRQRPVAGVLLFSDGNATDLAAKTAKWSSLGFPVFPVVEPMQEGLKDLRIETRTVRQSDFEASPVSIDVQLSAIGIGRTNAVVSLVDAAGKSLQQKTVLVPEKGLTEPVQFRFRPEKSGVSAFQVRAVLESEKKRAEEGNSRVEATLVNNSRAAIVDRGRGPYRILYIAGRPNWEHKFLKRALDTDDEIQLVSLLRIANKEPKFSFRDNKVDSSNPIFKGFDGKDDEDKEQYDEPVLVRMGHDAADELSRGFPKTADELYMYHAIILDDIEHGFFSQEQLLLIRQFVTMRGGGLLFLGGKESFNGKSFQNSTLGELAPVYTADRGTTSAETGPGDGTVRYRLTREGWLEPWLRVKDTEAAEKQRLAEMPPLEVINRVRAIKPGASLLAELVSEEGQSAPGLVAQRFGKGRTAAMLTGDLWRWGMHHEGSDEAPLFQAWRQTIRWLISDVPRRVDIEVLPSNKATSTSTLQVTVRDEEFKPMDNATIELKVKTPNGETVELSTQHSTVQAGVFEAAFLAREDGAYIAEAVVTAPDGSDVGARQTGWVNENAASEFRTLESNRALLEEIARETGGELVKIDELDQFVASLPNRKIPITENWVYPLWHSPWVMLFALACFCGEWGLRRMKGLA